MNHSEDLLIKKETTLKEALEIIDKGTMRIAIVVDDDNKLLGTLNDGDIRRALLNSHSLDMPIIDVYQKKPTVCKTSDSRETIIQTAIKKKVYQIPIVDKDNRLIDVEDLATLLTNISKKNKVILMAGGLGTRLQPLTNDTPKPLLKVGEKPILQTIIENFATYGFKDIVISVNYKSNMIKEYFGDGSNFGVNISYIEESKRLGTAGALSLIEEEFTEPFFVNAGIYLLSPEVIKYIPKNTFYDMPTLFEKLIEEERKVLSFPIHEYWLDIGRMEDFKRAQIEFNNI